ncbi:MAG TPA: hypothetical protein VMS08_03635 [Candidatus Saccharimonadia bacterium]|nr:hypothetical protein [Candidatus Saccharimonadia bacterium]
MSEPRFLNYIIYRGAQDAALHGADLDANPYAPGTQDAKDWAQGLKDYIDKMNDDLYPRTRVGSKEGWP